MPLDEALARAVQQRALSGDPHRDRVVAPEGGTTGEARTRTEPVLQRKLATKSATIVRLDRSDADLTALGEAIDRYNKSTKSTRSAGDWTTCFANLRDVWRRAYRWIDQHATGPHLLDEQRGVPELRRLISEAEAEHETLVAQTKGMDDVVPFDLGVTSKKKEKRAAGKLWRDLVANRGKIKCIGDDAFNRRMLSELAMLLETPTGRRLLAFLNEPKDPREDPHSDEALLTNVYLGERTSQLPLGVRQLSPLLQDLNQSEAQPLGIDEVERTRDKLVNATRTPRAETDDVDGFPVIDASEQLSEIADAAWSGRPGFVSGNEKFTFASGTGSFVTALRDRPLNAGRDDREILSPSWVTLGHELGHAANIKAGASLIQEKPFDGSLTERLTQGPKRDHGRWDNAEEMVNIENVENALRREAELSERDSHQTPKFVVREVATLKHEVRVPLDALYGNCADWNQKGLLYDKHPEYVALYRLGNVPSKELMSPKAMADWRARLNAFLTRWTEGPRDAPRPNTRLKKWFAKQQKLKENPKRKQSASTKTATKSLS